MIDIREASAQDIPLILQYIKELAEYEKLSHEVVATEETIAQTLFGERPFAEVLLAKLDGVEAGFAIYFYNYSTFLSKPGIYLEDLYVKQDLRGHGVGKALLQQLAKKAVAQGCGRVEWSVLDWNEPSIQFYKSLGAIPMDEWTVFRLTGQALEAFGTS